MTKVKINYSSEWNEICAKLLDKFGLPGQQYTTYFTIDYIVFEFPDDHDAMLARLMF